MVRALGLGLARRVRSRRADLCGLLIRRPLEGIRGVADRYAPLYGCARDRPRRLLHRVRRLVCEEMYPCRRLWLICPRAEEDVRPAGEGHGVHGARQGIRL